MESSSIISDETHENITQKNFTENCPEKESSNEYKKQDRRYDKKNEENNLKY